MKEKIIYLRENSIFQRAFYFLFLFLWSFLLLNKVLEYPMAKSSVGLTYLSLYLPIAVILLLQTIFNLRFLWWVCLIIFFTATLFLYVDQIDFYNEYKTKSNFQPMDLLFWLIELMPMFFVDFILIKIKPQKRKATTRPWY